MSLELRAALVKGSAVANADGHSGLMSCDLANRLNPDGEAAWLPQQKSSGILGVEREPPARLAAEWEPNAPWHIPKAIVPPVCQPLQPHAVVEKRGILFTVR
jgi:hypothetical protein